MKYALQILVLVSITFVCVSAHGQDIAQIGKDKPFKLSGGLSVYTGFYSTDLSDPRQVPLTGGVQGNLNLSIYDLQIPLSFIYSEKDRSFRQPFNQYGLSPRYKWIKVHAGHRSMNFSKLTLGGHRFFGGGVELTPGKFNFAAMYGNLRREVFADTTQGTVVEPSFVRRGFAAKIGMGDRVKNVELILFRANDQFDERLLENGRYGTAQPEENLVGGLNVSRRLTKSIQFKFEGAVSFTNVGLTPQTRTGEFAQVANDFDSFLFNFDPTTRRGTAIKSGISYNKKGVTLSAKYDRISPFFKTLGNYYFLSDQENIRGEVGFTFAKRKVRMSLSGGVQQNDLARVNAFRTKRIIGGANLSYNPGKAYSAMFNYSNFEADMRSTFQALGTDSIQFKQVSHNATFNQSLRYRDKDKKTSSSFNLAASYQLYVNRSSTETDEQNTSSYTGSLSYRHRDKDKAHSYGMRFTYTSFNVLNNRRNKYGLSLNGRKGFNENRTGVNSRFAFYLNRADIIVDNASIIFSIGLDQKIARAHKLAFSVNYNTRGATTVAELEQYQVRGQLRYSISFKPKKKPLTSPPTPQ